MFYTELAPHASLKDYIRLIWVFEAARSDAASATQRIVPDGYPELVLHYGDVFHEFSDARTFDASEMSDSSDASDIADSLKQQSRLLFAGQISRPLVLKPGATAGVIGIRFWPAGARSLLGISMHETTDIRLNMIDYWGAESEHLLDEVHSTHSPQRRVTVIEKFLMRKLGASRTAPDSVINHCVELLHRYSGDVTVDALAEKSQLSTRQLERRFLQEVGIPPRLLASIIRFRRLFDVLEQSTPSAGKWTKAALTAGYFDQAHMIRDFKRFAGLSPEAFHSELQGLSAAMIGAG